MALPANATALERWSRAARLALTVLVLAYLVLPVVVILPLSLTSGELLVYPLPGWSLRWYRELAADSQWVEAGRNSVALAVVTTLVATVTGTLAAFGLHGLHRRWKPWLLGLLGLPLIVPGVIGAVALFYFYARLGLVGSFAALVLAHTVLAVPFVVIAVSAALQGLDPNLPRAAASLGASPLQGFVRVTLPVLRPGLVAGAVLAFVTSFDELLVVLFVGGPGQRTLPRQIFAGVTEGISPSVAAAAVVLIAVSLTFMAVVELLRRRSERLRGAHDHR